MLSAVMNLHVLWLYSVSRYPRFTFNNSIFINIWTEGSNNGHSKVWTCFKIFSLRRYFWFIRFQFTAKDGISTGISFCWKGENMSTSPIINLRKNPAFAHVIFYEWKMIMREWSYNLEFFPSSILFALLIQVCVLKIVQMRSN